MTLETTDNLNLIREILTDPDCWNACSEDGQDAESFEIKASNVIDWIVARNASGELAGCLKVNRVTLSEVEAHIAIKKRNRGVFSSSVVVGLLRIFVNDMDKRINKLTAQVPSYNKACIRLAVAMGFKKEGINRESVMKNGKFYDQARMGITRKEAELCLQY